MQFRRLLLGAAALLWCGAAAGGDLFELHGILSASGMAVRSQRSWIAGGFGRLDAGAGSATDREFAGFGSVQLAADYHPRPWLDVHAHGIARVEPSGDRGSRGGVVEAYADLRPVDTDRHRLRIRAGMFFLPTSRENVDDLWSSPYTLTLSALNSWIAQELRPVGGEAEYRLTMAGGNRLIVAAGVFGGNDSAGTLLAWRGWSAGSRLTTWNEVLPLPPLHSLQSGGQFESQRPDGLEPIGRDRDGRPGWTLRGRWQVPDRFTVQLAHYDNRGDRQLHRGEYAWQTHFNLLSSDWEITDRTTLAGEIASGSTGMGPPGAVQADFYTAYLLASQRIGRHRLSVRLDTFQTDDRDHGPSETNTERGSAVTLAWFFEPLKHVRLGLEWLSISGRRPAAAESGYDPNTDGRALTGEIRYRF